MLIRVLLAVDKSPLLKRLHTILHKLDALIMPVPNAKSLSAIVVSDPFDILIVKHDWLPAQPAQLLDVVKKLPGLPQVIIISDVENPTEQAHLLTAGCEAILSEALPKNDMAEMLAALVERRIESREEILGDHIESLTRPRLTDFVSNSPRMHAFLKLVRRVVKTDSSLLITGETGVGKERLARAIHSEGTRRDGPFIAINCAALPDNLLESELFGHERGAFTGATNARRGAFEMAHRGTIFLDEIGEMPLKLQVKLLRVLQERAFLRVGGEKAIQVDVRIMAATNRELVAECEANAFRRDLYFRLSVVTLLIPPLRQRREDIQELIINYIAYLGPRINAMAFGIHTEAMNALIEYDWPGNVRELINVIERGLLLCEGEEIGLPDLPDEIARTQRAQTSPPALPVADWATRPWKEIRAEVLDAAEKQYLQVILKDCHGCIGEAATRVGIAPRNLYVKMKKHGLRKEDYK